MNKRTLISSSLLLLLMIAMGVTAFFVTQGGQFDLRKRASAPGGDVTLTLQPGTQTYAVGDTLTTDVMLNTGGRAISGVAMRLVFPYNASSPVLDVIDADPQTSGIQIQSTASILDASFATNVNVAQGQPSGQMFIDFSATTNTTAGYSNTTGQKIATITFKAKRAGVVAIEHDPTRSQVTDKATSLDVLRTIPTYELTVVDDTQKPTVTITAGPDNNATLGSGSVTFTWSGADLPARGSNVTAALEYAYQFNGNTWSSYGTATTVTRVLNNGSHVFRVRARDGKGNVSDPVTPTSQRSFTINIVPAITSINPPSGTGGTQVTITGTNFGTAKKIVRFGAVQVPGNDILSWTNTQITVKAPANGNGNVTVNVDGRISNGVPFTVGGNFTIHFNFEDVTLDRGTRNVYVKVKHPSNGFTQEFALANTGATWDASRSSYKVTLALNTLTTANNYTVWIDGGSHMVRRFTGVALANGAANTMDKRTTPLLIADFNDDNKFNIEDFGLMMSKITQLSRPIVSAEDITAYGKYDLNMDNTLDISDVTFLLSRYTTLEKVGDPLN